MQGLLFLSVTINILGLVAWFFYRRELTEVLVQIKRIKKGKSHTYLKRIGFSKRNQELIEEINELMEKFQQTTEEKKRTDQRNKQMLASISHDFRTPLTSMLGYIQMVDKKNLNSKDVKYLSIIEERTQLISKLIDEFYLLSLLDADDYKITKEACNPVRLVQEQVAQYYEELSQSFKQIEIELEEERIVIQTSIIDFNRIVQNLIKNAYNHGTGTFKVQLKKETNQLLFIFENQVPSENEIDVFRLFDRNYQGNHARISGNAGLGLSIAKELSEKLGFRLSATAEKDWLQFQLVIPVEEWKMRSFNVEKTQYQNTR